MSNAIYLIYKHTSPSGKSYIGQTKNYNYRCWRHQKTKGCIIFYNAIQKYGWDNFKHEILISGLTLDQANKYEEFYISEHNTLFPNGYNIKLGGLNNQISTETRRKMSVARTGKVFGPHSEDRKLKISIANTGRPSSQKGIKKGPLSDIVKQKISTANTGRIWTEDQKLKLHKPKNRKKVECPHCGKIGDVSGMTRCHFNNCKKLIT